MSTTTGGWSGSSRNALTQACRALLVTGFVTVALLGAAVSSAFTVLVVGPVLGALAGGLVALTEAGPPQRPSAGRARLVAAGAGLLLLPFFAGVALLGVVGAVVALALLGLGVLAGVAHIVRLPRLLGPRLHGVAVQGTPGQPIATKPTTDFVRVLQTRRLLEEWRSSSAHVHGPDPIRRLEAVELRDLLLEELSRRHPQAVARWLMHGGDEDPQRYIGDDRDLAA